MSSGLEAFADISNPNEPMMRIIEGTRVNEAALSFRSVRAPGTSFSFGNAESQLLAMVLERVSGKPYWDILSEWIWRPIGAGTGIVRMDRLQGNANAFCCMLGGPHDWLRFGVMLMRDGRVGDEQVLPENWVKTMLEPAPTNANYGLHIWRGHPQRTKRLYGPGLEADLASEPYLAPDLFLMVGGGGIRMWMVPSKDLVILRLADPAPDFDETVIPNTILRALR
jgi:CubicO group peptidase (beta-lactamase class C family)